jgi:hypothetical protein
MHFKRFIISPKRFVGFSQIAQYSAFALSVGDRSIDRQGLLKGLQGSVTLPRLTLLYALASQSLCLSLAIAQGFGSGGVSRTDRAV